MQSTDVKKAAIEMFGFIWKQPIHVTLRQMRIVQVLLIYNSQLLLWALVNKIDKLDPAQGAAAAGATMLALIAAIWKCVDSFNKGNVKDE